MKVACFLGFREPGVEIDALGGSNILDMLEVDGVLYIATDGDGVMRYSVANGVMLSDWSTANSLHSDEITSMLVSGNQLVMASSDAGLARYDWSSGFWLSTWNSGNWLSSNDVTGLARSGNTLYILNGDALHTYNAASNVFSGSQTIDAFGLAGAGDELILWPNTGTRSPGSELILVSDGYGALVELTPGSTPLNTGVLLLGSGPTSGQMIDSTELNGVLFVATDDQYLNRFDTQASRWIEPIFIGADLNRLSNDGNHVYIAADKRGSSNAQQWNCAPNLGHDKHGALKQRSDRRPIGRLNLGCAQRILWRIPCH